MEAHELLPGQRFRIKGEKRSLYRTVFRTIELINHDHISPVGRKVLILDQNCRQISPLKNTEVETTI